MMYICSIITTLLITVGCPSPSSPVNQKGLLYDYQKLEEARKLYLQGKDPYASLVSDLIADADQLLTLEPPSVVDKIHIAPSGNRHDYYSVGPYWWPNPETEDGLPYIRHDGKKNPEYDLYDSPRKSQMANAVFDLSLAYFYTGQENYAHKAVELLSVWFIHPETRMTPHLEYGQAIPGIVEGRGIGIIETGSFLNVINAVGLIRESAAIDDLDLVTLKKWFKDYNEWLITSDKGWDERKWHNNHGSSYDSQVATFSMFVGEDSVAQMILDSVKIKRIDRQIKPDGSQPWELQRTKSMGYSLKNLLHLMENAILAETYGIDLWNYESADGGSIKKAVHFLIPYMLDGKEWPYTQYGGIESQMKRFKEAIWIASLYLDDEWIDRTAYSLISTGPPWPEFLLMYPAP